MLSLDLPWIFHYLPLTNFGKRSLLFYDCKHFGRKPSDNIKGKLSKEYVGQTLSIFFRVVDFNGNANNLTRGF